jgi:putative flippase GtrA
MSTAIRYIFFAIVSTFVNLAFQYLSFYIYIGAYDIYIAMAIGTFSGLVVKYILDKKFIFYYEPQSKKDDSEKFIVYALMGLFTTFIFWGFELGFDYLFEFDNAKYIGAIIGLSVGYIVKYFLDKNFVFKEK